MDQKQYTLQSFFESPKCLEKDIMRAYIDGTASDQEVRSVEMHIADCPLCEDALEGMMMLSANEFNSLAESLQSDIQSRVREKSDELESAGGMVIDFRPNSNVEVEAPKPSATKPKKRWMGFVGMAASIALLAVLGIFMMQPNGSSIADKYFDATVISSTRGMGSLDQVQFDKAVEYYEAKSYSKAAPLFDNVDSIVAAYFAGNCYYHIEDFPSAEDRFKKVIAKNQTWVEHAEYNLAMTYLKLGKTGEAKDLLTKIATDDNQDFQDLAKEALAEVVKL